MAEQLADLEIVPLQVQEVKFDDYATIVSIMPGPFESEQKPGVYPSAMSIPPAKAGDFQVRHISQAKTPVYRMEGESIDSYISAFKNALAIAEDYWKNIPGTSDICHPGVMVLPGKLSKEEVEKKFGSQLDQLRVIQTNYFRFMVREADNLWNRHHSHRMITDNHRSAARLIGYKAEWNQGEEQFNRPATKDCPVCWKSIDSRAIVCGFCSAILDEEKAKKYGLVGKTNLGIKGDETPGGKE